MKHSDEIRYSRNMALSEIGKVGQEKLLRSSVLVVGAGGLASPLLLYLASAGVGKIGIVDDDKVEISNLQRQIIHETGDVGISKVISARDSILDINPDIDVEIYNQRLDEQNSEGLVNKYDIVADCSDNFATRFLVNDTCHKIEKTLVSAAITGFSGQLYSFKSYLGKPYPCYRCLYSGVPDDSHFTNCENAGVLGAAVGVMGAWQSIEIIKELLSIGDSLAGNMVVFDALSGASRKVKISRNPECECCGG